jgi:hypothetical protein
MIEGSNLLKATNVSSDICAQEPIHLPGAIQPHALLVGLDALTLDLLTKSVNVAALFPGTALADVPTWLPPEVVEAFRDLERTGRSEQTLRAEIAGLGATEVHCFKAAGVVFCEYELTSSASMRARRGRCKTELSAVDFSSSKSFSACPKTQNILCEEAVVGRAPRIGTVNSNWATATEGLREGHVRPDATKNSLRSEIHQELR